MSSLAWNEPIIAAIGCRTETMNKLTQNIEPQRMIMCNLLICLYCSCMQTGNNCILSMKIYKNIFDEDLWYVESTRCVSQVPVYAEVPVKLLLINKNDHFGR